MSREHSRRPGKELRKKGRLNKLHSSRRKRPRKKHLKRLRNCVFKRSKELNFLKFNWNNKRLLNRNKSKREKSEK